MHTRVVTHNSRVSVSHDSQRTWHLHIRQVKESDRGCYMCQINTAVMKSQLGCIDVHGEYAPRIYLKALKTQQPENKKILANYNQVKILFFRKNSENFTWKVSDLVGFSHYLHIFRKLVLTPGKSFLQNYHF